MRTYLAITAFCLSLGGVAVAKGTVQNHHCKMPDGTMDMAKTKAECSVAKGKWSKDAAAPAAGAPAADAPPPAAAEKK